MAETRPRTITIHTDSYAPWGTITTGPPEHPDASKTAEDFRKEREADRISYGEVLSTFGWSDDDFSTAKHFQFPAPIGRHMSGPLTGQSIYMRSQINAWIDRLSAFAQTLTK